MFCSKCGKQLKEGQKFCDACGHQVSGNDQTVSDSKRKSISDEGIHQCPNCGSHINAFELTCKNCGYELRSSNASSIVKEFAERLEITDSAAKKNALISNFYVPNTREDIYEFFILAISNLTTDSECEKAWKTKVDQTFHKAKLSFGNTPEFAYIDKIYDKTMMQYNGKSIIRLLRNGGRYLLGAFLFLLGLFIILGGLLGVSESGDDYSPVFMLVFLGIVVGWLGVVIFSKGAKRKSSSEHEVE